MGEIETGALIFGEAGAGKTSLLLRLTGEQLAADHRNALVYVGPKGDAAEFRAGMAGKGLAAREADYELGGRGAARAGLFLAYGYDLGDATDRSWAAENLLTTFETLEAMREDCQGTLVVAVDEVMSLMPPGGGERSHFASVLLNSLNDAFAFDEGGRRNFLPIFSARSAQSLLEAFGDCGRGVFGHFRNLYFLRDGAGVNDHFVRGLSGGGCTVSTSQLLAGDCIEVRGGGCRVVRSEWQEA